MATGERGGVDVPFPVRGMPGGWRDDWEEDDVATVGAELAAFNAATAVVAAEWNAEQRRELGAAPYLARMTLPRAARR